MRESLSLVRWSVGAIVLTTSIGVGLVGVVSNVSADGPRADYGGDAALTEQYKENCGDCHLAYPPSFLPQDSWRLIMHDLANHFDEDAELEVDETKAMRDYLVDNSSRFLWRFRHQGEGEIPMRITQLNYFLHEHDEIPKRLVQGNDEVGSFSNCSACHDTDSRRMFDDDDVNIPGYGYWDD